MANSLASRKVSPRFHDPFPLVMHTANMARKAHTRWFLREWRKDRLLTQDQLAERTGLSKPYISQLESGKRQFTQELLELFAEHLRCEPADLIVRDPSQPDGIWSIWDQLEAPQRTQLVEIGKALRKAG